MKIQAPIPSESDKLCLFHSRVHPGEKKIKQIECKQKQHYSCCITLHLIIYLNFYLHYIVYYRNDLARVSLKGLEHTYSMKTDIQIAVSLLVCLIIVFHPLRKISANLEGQLFFFFFMLLILSIILNITLISLFDFF